MEKNALLNRKGRLKLSRGFMYDGLFPDAVKCLFSNFYPIGVSNVHKYDFNDFLEYYGYSEYFRVLSEGELIPEYDFVFKTDENDVCYISEVVEIK